MKKPILFTKADGESFVIHPEQDMLQLKFHWVVDINRNKQTTTY